MVILSFAPKMHKPVYWLNNACLQTNCPSSASARAIRIYLPPFYSPLNSASDGAKLWSVQWNSPSSKAYKHSKLSSFSFFYRFWLQLFRKTAISCSSFILRRKTKRHLVRHVILVWMVYDSSRDHKMAASFFKSALYFQKKKTFYFITPYHSSSSSQGKTFYIVL